MSLDGSLREVAGFEGDATAKVSAKENGTFVLSGAVTAGFVAQAGVAPKVKANGETLGADLDLAARFLTSGKVELACASADDAAHALFSLNRLKDGEATPGDLAFLTKQLKSVELSLGQAVELKESVGLDLGGGVASLNAALGGRAKTGLKVEFAEGRPDGLTTFVEASASGNVKAGLKVGLKELFGKDSKAAPWKEGVLQGDVVVRVETRQPLPAGASLADFQKDPKAAAFAAMRGLGDPERNPLATRTLTVSSETVSDVNVSAHQTELTVKGKSSFIGSAAGILLALSGDIEGLRSKLAKDDAIDLRTKTSTLEKHGFKEVGIGGGGAELSATAQSVKARTTSSRHPLHTQGVLPPAVPASR